MKNRIINTTLILTAILFLAVLAVRVRAGVTADSVAVLKASGMTCGSCADRISRALQGIKGVASTRVDLDGGRVIVGYDTKTVKPETLAENITKAGYDSTVQQVVTPEQYRRRPGGDAGTGGGGGPRCCGGCGAGDKSR